MRCWSQDHIVACGKLPGILLIFYALYIGRTRLKSWDGMSIHKYMKSCEVPFGDFYPFGVDQLMFNAVIIE